MPGFTPRPYRSVLAAQLRDLVGCLPDALAALVLVAAIGCACMALEPTAPSHAGRFVTASLQR